MDFRAAPPRSGLLLRIGSPRPDKKRRLRSMRLAGDMASDLLERLGGREQRRIVQLWRNWKMVMGADLCDLAIPVDARGRVLLIGGEDNMAMQELVCQIPEILERVNAFMDAPHFERVEVQLLSEREIVACLSGPRSIPALPGIVPSVPPGLEELQGRFDPASPIGRYFAAYLRMAAGLTQTRD
jgi:hypothetical protein